MRVAVLPGQGVPNPAAGGGTLTSWTLVSYLLDKGHEVVVVPLLSPEYLDPTGAQAEERIERLRALGAEVRAIRSVAALDGDGVDRALLPRLRRAWSPEPERLYPNLLDREAVRETIEEVRPDAVFAYHWESLAACHRLHAAPKLGVCVDLSHLVQLYRWRASLPRGDRSALRAAVGLQAVLRRQPALMVELMRDCEAAGDFAAHHAAWLRRKGAAHCEYLRTPIPDPLGARWRAAREAAGSRERPRLLLIGHLKGLATVDGLDTFATRILPRLERALGAERFEVRLVGGYEPPPRLRRALGRPSITFCGHREDPTEEFLSADLLVVPTRIPLGTRVRILSGFSYGCCVVAHASNALGIPELSHGENVLLGRGAADLAGAILHALRDEGLRRRLQAGGRRTYEECFSPPVAAGRIEEILGKLPARGRAARDATP